MNFVTQPLIQPNLNRLKFGGRTYNFPIQANRLVSYVIVVAIRWMCCNLQPIEGAPRSSNNIMKMAAANRNVIKLSRSSRRISVSIILYHTSTRTNARYAPDRSTKTNNVSSNNSIAAVLKSLLRLSVSSNLGTASGLIGFLDMPSRTPKI